MTLDHISIIKIGDQRGRSIVIRYPLSNTHEHNVDNIEVEEASLVIFMEDCLNF